ncbi:unnamed protein product [Penicillium salamii]|uniref:Aminoglycoside phosphotransferase domain-containing protein n=1 Tax=Penicillium salamii TaxID=1612424 RepID=A0A9W4NKE3_9EURO|nr:unnamed protein product [Penicillium salamii]CAG7973706.1 unnamed protein product [Penicillium salamii]CAG8031680.1 unnamed protein product [Penicillium salamii]CAG8060138.1 unnamed protein product [Penicillium salamii]CAG8100017.1 unnamed protein product [Penicillium salamii]
MPHWSCEYESCNKPAAQRAGDCLLCDRHFCRTHRREPWHKCPKPEENWDSYSAQYAATEARHIDELCLRIDCSKLCFRASMLREGIPCTVDLSRKSLMMGNQNIHAEITFDDNVKWLARFRLARTSSPPREVRDWILRSEAATMIYLQRYTCIPTPKIFDWACESDPENPLGVDYILMEKLNGKSLDWQTATSQQKEKIMQQLVDIFLEIDRHPFEAIGSLISLAENVITLQGLAHQSTFRVGKGPLGPFSSPLEGSTAILKSYLTMIANGEIDPCCPVDTYLFHRFRQDIATALFKDVPLGEQFFLKHPDDKGDHILVNDSFDIVGVIDWEWTQTVSKAEAFCSPCMMWPVAEFYNGLNELAADELRLAAIFREKGREDLAACVLEGRKVQRFFFALGSESSFLDMQTLSYLFAGLRRAFNFEDEDWEAWKSKALKEWKDDDILLSLLELE